MKSVYLNDRVIPKTIHVIPGGDDGGPVAVEKGFPGWDVKIWDQERYPGYEDFICADILFNPGYDQELKNYIIKYELLRLEGGGVVSSGMDFTRPVDSIMLESCIHLVSVRGRVLSTSLMISPRHCGFWEFLLYRIRAAVYRNPNNFREISWWAGEYFLGESTRLWLNDNWASNDLADESGTVVGRLYEHADLVIWSPQVIKARYLDDAEGEGDDLSYGVDSTRYDEILAKVK